MLIRALCLSSARNHFNVAVPGSEVQGRLVIESPTHGQILCAKTLNGVAEIGAVELVSALILLVSKPLPSGLNGTKPTPSS